MTKLADVADMRKGIDMIAHFCLQNFDRDFVYTMALEGLDFMPEGTHGQFYLTESYGSKGVSHD